MLKNMISLSRSGIRATIQVSRKNIFLSTNKANKLNIADALKKQQKPVEVIKWVLLVIPVSAFGLGCWQVQRLFWKLQLIDIMEAKTNAVPVDFPQDLSKLETMEYMPVKVQGEFLHDKEILIGPRALIGREKWKGSLVSDPKTNQGWLIITPFKLTETGQIILINRGWVHQNKKSKDSRKDSMIKGQVELVGVVRLSEKRPPFMLKNNPQKGSWFYRDLEEMSQHIGCLPVWLDARGIEDPPEGWPIPNQTRVALRNEHMSYIITWYGLSLATGYLWHRKFMKKLPLL